MNAPKTNRHAYLQMLGRRKWLLVAILVVVPGAVYAYSAREAKTYEASVAMRVQASVVDTSLFTGDRSQLTPQAVNVAARLAQTTAVAQEAAKKLQPPPSNPRSLLDQITATPDVESGLVTITASAPSGELAADLANAFGAAVVIQRTNQAVGRLDATIGEVTSQLTRLGGEDRDGRSQLSEQLQRLRALRAAQGSNAEIVEAATAPTSASSPKPLLAAAGALAIALLLVLGAVALAARLDRRLRDPNEIADLTDVPILTVVPQSAFSDENRSSFPQEEAFQQLCASLTFLSIERPLSNILVTSPAAGDGTTTVATKLAVALTRAGKDVILVDADVRTPQVAQRLGIDPRDGLGSALVFESAVDSLLVELEVDAPEGARLRVLPAGSPPPNPSGLIASARMRILLAQLGAKADIVIIDTSPVLAVGDSMPLLKEVSGIVVVVKINATTRDSVSRLQRLIADEQGVVLGIVATNVVHRPLGEPGYEDGYGGGTSDADGDRDAVGSSAGRQAEIPR